MEKMIKTIAYNALLGLILLMTGCKEQTALTVGEFKSNTYVLGNIGKIKNYWTMVLQHNKIDVKLENYKIIAKEDTKSKQLYYMLVGSNKDYSFTIAVQVFLNGSKIEFNDRSLKKGSASCGGCTTGCGPEQADGDWVCTNDCETACRKTITIAHEENNYTTPIQAFLERY
ncbi:hypothetical protein DBR32_12730 [Taibaiella sp. KBW10]|uniref:hypothetical protein n=1 Tax=Taibaiella sp. KBW10 TaxID=2153357 RepID=UPI000F59AD11|nr:hypothetical protein [Taibaiella sp. KBW10]RQO30424.1 hypothetical protein DBR32_12730 [Taibaiella sp. KBW10]